MQISHVLVLFIVFLGICYYSVNAMDTKPDMADIAKIHRNRKLGAKIKLDKDSNNAKGKEVFAEPQAVKEDMADKAIEGFRQGMKGFLEVFDETISCLDMAANKDTTMESFFQEIKPYYKKVDKRFDAVDVTLATAARQKTSCSFLAASDCLKAVDVGDTMIKVMVLELRKKEKDAFAVFADKGLVNVINKDVNGLIGLTNRLIRKKGLSEDLFNKALKAIEEIKTLNNCSARNVLNNLNNFLKALRPIIAEYKDIPIEYKDMSTATVHFLGRFWILYEPQTASRS